METNSLALIITSVILIIALIFLYLKMNNGFGPFNLKVYGLTLIIGFTVIISLTDVGSEKLNACYGILGAMAGYLFGLNKEK